MEKQLHYVILCFFLYHHHSLPFFYCFMLLVYLFLLEAYLSLDNFYNRQI